MTNLLLRLIVNAAAIYVAAWVLDGISVSGDVVSLLIVALIFGVINALIKPIVQFFTCPFYILTLGLFTFIVNALMLELTDWIAGDIFVVRNFWWALIGGIVISVVSTLLSIFLSEDDED